MGMSFSVSDLGVKRLAFCNRPEERNLAGTPGKRSLNLSGHKTGKVWIWVVQKTVLVF